MYRDEDVLLRSIRRLAEALARWAAGGPAARAEAEQALAEATGLSFATIEALPAQALVAMFGTSDELGRARLAAIADALDAAAAAPTPKAQALRDALS